MVKRVHIIPLSDRITGAEPAHPLLPLFHTTQGYRFLKMLSQDRLAISCKPCPVMQEQLVYCFYGRPAYRAGQNQEPTENPIFLPVCILLDPSFVQHIRRVLPFDSGAMNAGMYSNSFHPDMTPADFLVGSNMRDAAKFITAFFGNNEQYYRGQPQENLKFGPFELYAKAYYGLIAKSSGANYDDRSKTIEIQIAADVELVKPIVKGIVLPTSFMDDEAIRYVLHTEWGSLVRTYDTHRAKPIEYQALVLSKAKELMDEISLPAA